MIEIRVIADEVILRLDRIPARLHEVLKQKYENIFAELQEKVATTGTIGKYLDPRRLTSGVEEVASSVVGYIEYKDRDDKYPIVPKTAALLRFRVDDGGWVRTPLVMHPYPKGKSTIEQLLSASKPWILEQLTDAVKDDLS